MGTRSVPSSSQPLLDALRQMEAALKLLDEAAAPAHIGARVDHAIGELRIVVENSGRRPPVWERKP